MLAWHWLYLTSQLFEGTDKSLLYKNEMAENKTLFCTVNTISGVHSNMVGNSNAGTNYRKHLLNQQARI